MNAPLYPPALVQGDTLGIIAPAGHLQDENLFTRGVEVLHSLGFKVKFPPKLWPGSDYLADNDENRGRELNYLFNDPQIQGLISLRGGYGCLRMLDRIDIDLVTRCPKLLVGFSDITVLQNYLYTQTGLVSIHGPVVTSLGNVTTEALESFCSCLKNPRAHCIDSAGIEILRDGSEVTAPVIGGNLASLLTLLGTPFDLSWDNKIVFLEDTNEPGYKIDRMLTQLKLAGKLDRLAGLILGDFSSSATRSEVEKQQYRQLIWNRVLELCSESEMPIWANFPSGHCPDNHSFPLGSTAVMTGKHPRLYFSALL